MDKNIQAWLTILCKVIPKVHSAIFAISHEENGQVRSLAKWPENLSDHDHLSGLAKHAIKKNNRLCLPQAQSVDGETFDFFALPIPIKPELSAVLAIKTQHLPEAKHKALFQSLKRNAQWLRLVSKPSDSNDANNTSHTDDSTDNNQWDDNFYCDAVGFLASCVEQEDYHKSLLKLVVVLAGQFNCDRVAFAEYNHHHSKVIALSNSADFDQRSNLIQSIADAMDEAIEQDSIVLFPQTKTRLIERSHRELASKFGSGSLCTIPLIHNEQFFGAVTLLSSEKNPLDDRAVNLCQQILSLITPYLILRRDQEKSIIIKLANTLGNQLKKVFGFKFLKVKLALICMALALLASNLIVAEHRISADAILEGKIQRVIAAPISGYVLSASVRAGDTVLQDDIMASLNDSDLRLEQAKLNGRLQKAKRKYREAQSSRDLVQVRVVKEQINQIKAEIDQNSEELKKTNLVAPFDGIVIEGDLSQLLGSPVERGDTLFKIAPLEGYRIILKVDEKNISHIKKGQTGILGLSSVPDSRFVITVDKIIAVAKAEEGANIFRVEASLENAPDLLRPGMEGIGKVSVGDASLWWIWTHEIRESVSLWLWSWLP